MFGARDVGWAVALGAVLLVLVPYRAERSAKSAVERDAEQGFREAYAGSRFTTEARSLELVGARPSLTGRSIEILARHVIKLANGAPGGEDASQEVHAKLERRGKTWAYTLFETRDGQLLDPAADGNPWARALMARQKSAAATRPAGPGSAPAGAHFND